MSAIRRRALAGHAAGESSTGHGRMGPGREPSRDAGARTLTGFGPVLPNPALYVVRLPEREDPDPVLAARWLQRAERERFERFRQARDRWRLLLGRILLRHVLTVRYGMADVQIAVSRWGRPFLPSLGSAGLDFNITHAGAWVGVGVTRVGAIGVDIVAESELTDWEHLAEHFLGPDERREIHMAPPQSRRVLAARAWVAKEAVLKAAGYGLEVDPRAVVLELRPAVRVRQMPEALPEPACLHLHEPGLPDRYCAAIACLGNNPCHYRNEVTELDSRRLVG
uniref:Putative phosphopantetheinyl transferase n=1 Tax=Aplysina aerophoba bacterial symbiont clone AANRPS TaxID=1042317 RepID=F8S2Z7_9BACT|nr:putative phosphopantetheinyl transferase [Aplysina aerophoba bacterial symbiont clone AANRPS]